MNSYSTKDSYELFVYYFALKKHFTTSSYDYFKYNGKINVNQKTFESRRDRFYFYKLSKQQDGRGIILSNMLDDPNKWLGDIVDSPQALAIYYDWKKRQQAISYVFTNDLNKLTSTLKDSILVTNGQYPKLLTMFNTGEICIETLIIIDHFGKIFDYWNTKISDPILWPDINNKCRKYAPFVKFDRIKMKKILVDSQKTYNEQ